MREKAIDAVVELIPETRLRELEPFARSETGPDPYDPLPGHGLKALVPRHWTVSRALPALLKSANENCIGELSFGPKLLPSKEY